MKEVNKYDLLTHKTGFSMLYSELNALQLVNGHAFIAHLACAFHSRESCFFVLDLKTGADLRYYLKKKLIFEECNVAFYVACISSALHHCHSHNVLHRDVKPENIILDDQGFPHLADFGVAYVQNDTNHEGTEALASKLSSGTKQYLAPEVFTKGHIHGPESDFWSLGIVAYELLHGSRPFSKVRENMISFLDKARIKYTYSADTLRKEREKESRHRRMEAVVSAGTKADPTLHGIPEKAGVDKLNVPINDSYGAMFRDSTDGNTTAAMTTQGSPGASPGHSRKSTPFGTPYASPQASTAYAAAITNATGDPPAVASSLPPSSSPSTNTRAALFPKISTTRQAGEVGGREIDPLISPGSPGTKSVSLISESTSHDLYQSQSGTKTLSTLEQSSSLSQESTHDTSCVYGTWWIYTQKPLDKELTVHVPHSNAWLGHISEDCQGVLKGLFEVRPTHRLGGRNIDKLRSHSWFEQRNLSDWDNLVKKDPEVTPHFIPGKNWVQERIGKGRAQQNEISSYVTAEQERGFADFHYTNPDLRHLFGPVKKLEKIEKVEKIIDMTSSDHDVALDIQRNDTLNDDKKLPDMNALSVATQAQAYTSYMATSGKINPGRLIQENKKAKQAAASDLRASSLLEPAHGPAARRAATPSPKKGASSDKYTSPTARFSFSGYKTPSTAGAGDVTRGSPGAAQRKELGTSGSKRAGSGITLFNNSNSKNKMRLNFGGV